MPASDSDGSQPKSPIVKGLLTQKQVEKSNVATQTKLEKPKICVAKNQRDIGLDPIVFLNLPEDIVFSSSAQNSINTPQLNPYPSIGGFGLFQFGS